MHVNVCLQVSVSGDGSSGSKTLTAYTQPRMVMQEVVDRQSQRKFAAAVLPAGVFASHSCTVHEEVLTCMTW